MTDLHDQWEMDEDNYAEDNEHMRSLPPEDTDEEEEKKN